ncbi:MAG: RNA polymerase sigma factor [Anaerolineae bacterium]|nr:RNA polymerase sigma factor [Anaerolineae bacterium]
MHPLTTLTDQELIKCCMQGDTRAFETLFERYARMLHRHAVCILHDESGAHDIVQETFIRVWARAEQWQGSGPVKAWLYRITTNLSLNHLRTLQRRREIALEIPADDGKDDDSLGSIPSWMVEACSLGPEALIEQTEEGGMIARRYSHILNRLTEEKRQVFLMIHEMEMSVRDTADALDIPEGTVKSRLHYARRQLAREWQELDKGG